MLKETCPEFQCTIHRIATVANLTDEAVYLLWRKYSAQCQGSDQSALTWEFVQQYEKQLGGNAEALRRAERAE
jgi:hypothetical protein